MKVLLKGGPWHNRVVDVASDKRELFVAEPTEVEFILEEEPSPIAPAMKVARYARSNIQGYGPFEGFYNIWFYEGSS